MKKDKKIRRELLDELLAGYSKPEDLTGCHTAGLRSASYGIDDDACHRKGRDREGQPIA
jgi:hypothetical protein